MDNFSLSPSSFKLWNPVLPLRFTKIPMGHCSSFVKEYQSQFEALANRIMGLPPLFYLNCFISCLKPAIHLEVQAFPPLSLTQAIST
jgi:hypothetical protein